MRRRGFTHISPRETEPVALRFASMGFNCCCVSYRYAPYRYPTPIQDAGAAVAYVRAHAEELDIDPQRIAIMGFSAGAYAAGSVGVRWKEKELWQPLGLSGEDVRPNAMLLCYPVITALEHAHRGSFAELTGSRDPSVHAPYSLERYVTSDAPTTFLWHTWDDAAVPVENTLIMASALRKAGISCEVHIYQHGSHGLALCDETTAASAEQVRPECATWIQFAAQFLTRLAK